MTKRPAPRPVDRWEKAEENAATWMRYWGYNDARVTPPGSDRGIDVRAGGALGQVKWAGRPTGRDAVQRLFGARGPRHDQALLFFTGPGHGYSQHAMDEADKLGVALFKYDIQGAMTPVNGGARRLVRAAGGAENNALTGSARDTRSEPNPAGTGCALVLAIFFTLLAGLIVTGSIVPAADDSAPSIRDNAISIVILGLLAGGLWLAWLNMRSSRRAVAPHTVGPANRQVPEGPVVAGNSRRVHRVLADPGTSTGPHIDENTVFTPSDVAWFEYRASVAEVTEALAAIHSKSGGRRPEVDMQNFRVTIAPDWVSEYVGLVTIVADMEQVDAGADSVTRISWSTYSQATPSTLEAANGDAQAAVERTNNVLSHILGQTARAVFNDDEG